MGTGRAYEAGVRRQLAGVVAAAVMALVAAACGGDRKPLGDVNYWWQLD